MKQYPADFRTRLLHALDAGLAPAEAARTFGVTDRTLRRWQHERRASGCTVAKPRRGRQRHIGQPQESTLRSQVATYADATLIEHCARWQATQGARVSVATMSRAITRLGLTVKKSP